MVCSFDDAGFAVGPQDHFSVAHRVGFGRFYVGFGPFWGFGVFVINRISHYQELTYIKNIPNGSLQTFFPVNLYERHHVGECKLRVAPENPQFPHWSSLSLVRFAPMKSKPEVT
jgi:hypothetical protein